MNEWPRAAQWLFEKLTEPPIDGIGEQVYDEDAPEGVTDSDTTWIAIETVDDGDDLTTDVGGYRVFTEWPVQVAAFKRGRSYQELKAAADEIDARLHRVSGDVVDGVVVLSCVRTSPVKEPYLKQGVEYRALGGVYALSVQPV